MRLAFVLLLILGVVSALPQNLLSDIASALGFNDDDPTSTVSSKTLVPPATADTTSAKSTKSSASRTSTRVTATKSSKTKEPSTTSTDSDDDEESSTITSAPTFTSTETPTPTPTPPPPPPPPVPSAPAATIADQPASKSSGVPAGGIAVAIIMTIAILLAIAWLLFRYHPGVQSWWAVRQEKKRQERSYRDAIDGPFARGGSGVRNAALGNSRKSMLASFFAPRTVHLGNGQEIRRKPVNWGASNAPPVPELPGSGVPMEKVALANMAAPMARTESTKSYFSYQSGSGGSSNGGVSNMSSPALTQKELPPMPPMPAVPAAAAGKHDPHKILSRKSIFELA